MSWVIRTADHEFSSSSHSSRGFEHAARPLLNGTQYADLRFTRTMRTYETGPIRERRSGDFFLQSDLSNISHAME